MIAFDVHVDTIEIIALQQLKELSDVSIRECRRDRVFYRSPPGRPSDGRQNVDTLFVRGRDQRVNLLGWDSEIDFEPTSPSR